MTRRTLVALLTAAAVCPAAASPLTLYTSRADFFSATGGENRYGFEIWEGFAAAPAPISEFGGGAVQATSTAGPASLASYGLYGNQILTGRTSRGSGGTVDMFQPVSLSFDPPRSAVAFDVVDLTPAGTEEAVITWRLEEDLLVVVRLQDGDANMLTPTFIGLTSTIPILGVHVTSNHLGSGNVPRTNGIDNLILATLASTVPEPATAGTAAILLLSRTRSRIRTRRPNL